MLNLKHISKIFDSNPHTVQVISNLTLSISEGEFVALVGPSGCGKTTLLKMVAGLVSPTLGEIALDGKPVAKPGSERGMVFQDFSLFPWLTARENIAFGLSERGVHKQTKEKIVNHYLRITKLEKFASFYPRNLSGGMQQRVAIARVLANNPKILLMDEPFGSLDAQSRARMQEFLTALWKKEHKTILFVTHDVGEAIFLADTVYIATARPLQIKQKIAIPFARPRSRALKQSRDFFECETRVARELELNKSIDNSPRIAVFL